MKYDTDGGVSDSDKNAALDLINDYRDYKDAVADFMVNGQHSTNTEVYYVKTYYRARNSNRIIVLNLFGRFQ